jgi:hypothetical protein
MKALLLALSCFALLAAACGSYSASHDSGSVDPSAATGAPAGPDTGVLQSDVKALDTKLILTSAIDLQVKSLTDSHAAIARLARDSGGFVADARFNDTGDENATASLRLRVPATRHDGVVASLRGLDGAEVKREESTAKEVTAEYTDLQSRLVNLQHTEAQYQQLLTRAGTIDEVLKVTAKLDSVRGDIEQVQGRINLIDNQSDYATVSVQLSLPPLAATTDAGGLPSPLRVFVTALDTSFVVAHALVNALMVLAVAGLWLLPAAAVCILVWRRFRRQVQAVRQWLT